MESLNVFYNPNFGQIRVIVDNEQPYFSASDICSSLGYSNPRKAVADHVDVEDVTKRDTLTPGGTQQLSYLNESGLYALVFGSKLEGAKQFKKWVTSEVLPSIRKNGIYATDITVDKMISDPDFAIQLLTNLKEEKQKRIQAELTVKEQAPKALFADAVATSTTSCLVGELSKILRQNGVEVGQNRLFDYLRKNGYLCQFGERYNQPTQRAMEMELFEVKKTSINKPDGTIMVTTTTKVTGKGQIYFVNKFLKSN